MNFKQQSFVTEYLRHRDACTAYCLAYKKESSNYEAIMSAANRLLNHPEVAAMIDSILGGIRQEVEMELKQELRKELLTIQRKREILAKIAAGEFYAVHNYKGKDCSMCSQHVWPTINQVLKAIDLDNKMAGHYTTAQASPGNKQYIKPSADVTLDKQVDKFIASLSGKEELHPVERVEYSRGEKQHEEKAPSRQSLSETVSLPPIEETSFGQPLSETVSLSPIEKALIGQQLSETVSLPPIEKALIGQQLSETISLPPIEKTLIEQQKATTASHNGLRRLIRKIS